MHTNSPSRLLHHFTFKLLYITVLARHIQIMVYHNKYWYILIYTCVSLCIPEILRMPASVHDEFSESKSFPLLLIQIGQELTLQGLSMCHSSAFRWCRQQASEELRGNGAFPQSPCAPVSYCLFHACCNAAASGQTKNCFSSGHGEVSPSSGSCLTGGWDTSSIATSRCPPRNPLMVHKECYIQVYTGISWYIVTIVYTCLS